MTYSQLITPNPDIPCTPGWCLMYVRQTFDLPAHYNTATEAWENSASQHRDWDLPDGVWHAVWFSMEAIPAGHVALRAPDGTVYSSSDNINRPHHHTSLRDLMDYYAYYNLPLTFLGWTEDVAGTPVIAPDGIAAMGTITPVQEDDMASVPQDEWNAVVAIVRSLDANVATRAHLQPILDSVVPPAGGITPAIASAWSDYNRDLILTAVKARPAGTPGAVDLDALVARLKAELPAAVLAELTAKLTKP